MMEDTFESYLGMRPNEEQRRPSSNILDNHLSPQLSLGSSPSGPQATASDFSLDELENMFDWDHSSQHFPSPSSSSTLSPPTDHLMQDDVHVEAQKAFGFFPTGIYDGYFGEPYSLNGQMPGIAIPATPLADGPTTISPSTSSSGVSTTSTWQIPPINAFTVPDGVQSTPTPPIERDDTNNNSTIGRKRSSSNAEFWQLEPTQQIKKVAHNAIERRYRTNINDRINDLKNVVPALYKAKVGEKNDDDESDDESGEQEIVDGIEVAKKLNKATILRKATEYILFLRRNNDLANRENQILQHIIGQMPGGQQVLNEFLARKREFQQQEQERLARERKEARMREQVQRQELLKERAAQRAALAQLLPKRERRPYRRRKKAEQDAKKSKAANKDQGPNQMFMAMYMCVAFFSASPFSTSDNAPKHNTASGHHYPHTSRIPFSNTTSFNHPSTPSQFFSLSTWTWLQIAVYTFGFVYLIVLPWLNRAASRRTSKKSHHSHHHYASEVVSSWHQLYDTMISHAPLSQSSLVLVLQTFYDMLAFLPFYRSLFATANVTESELTKAAAWTRLSEMQCLGAEPSVTKLQLLRSCAAMLSRIHLLERDPRLVTDRTTARVNITAAIQLRLVFGPNRFSDKLAGTHPPQQIMSMLANRTSSRTCPTVFYSYVLPYLVTPLDWSDYWLALDKLQAMYIQWMLSEGNSGGLFDMFSTKDVPAMVAWWTHLGKCLGNGSAPSSSLEFLHALIDKDEKCPSSVLLKRHCRSIYHFVQAANEIESSNNSETCANHLEQALADHNASADCIAYLAPADLHGNHEADLLHLSTLAVHLHVYRRLSGTESDLLQRYRQQIKERIVRQVELPIVDDECREKVEAILSN